MAMAAQARGAKQMIFDWHKAARLIIERKAKTASAGLKSDWEYTGGLIFQNGDPITGDYTYLSSNWATPQLDLDGEIIDCFIMDDNNPEGWNSDTKWPRSALAILHAN